MAKILNRYFLATIALGLLAACGQKGGETRLSPETRDGVFYLNFAEAQDSARAAHKLIMLEMWRPG